MENILGYRKKFILPLVLVALFLGYFWRGQLSMLFRTRGYQAVFLTNGQVYFGKLSTSGHWLKLSDIYYLQVTAPLQQSGEPSASVSDQSVELVKLGNELHGPSDAMYIEQDQVLFWENMKSDSKVVQAIIAHNTK